MAEQIKALFTVLDSFGNAKTLMNPNASRHGRYLELHFTSRGRISGAKVLTYGLDKSRLTRLMHEERTYHVFYQFLAGATPPERDYYALDDPSEYALLASSGTYRLPAGPFSDDSISMSELRTAMKTLGFKQKHTSAIFSLLVAILLLGNLTFRNGDAHDSSAVVMNPLVLEHAARLLGVTPDDLAQSLTTKTNYVKKELYTVLLSAEQSAVQRDRHVRDLYAILFAFVVENVNQRVSPSSKDPPPHTQIMLLDQPGYQTRGSSGTTSIALSGQTPLLNNAYGQNGFDEFCINFSDELLHSYYLRHTFEDTIGFNAQLVGDGISLPSISTMDNGACVELLRGVGLSDSSQRKPAGILGVMNKAASNFKSGKGSQDHRNEDMLQLMHSTFGVHASFVASPAPVPGGAQDRNLFAINHYAGSASYDITGWIENDADLLDAAFVVLLRGSSESFVSKLLSGPSLAAEKHNKDESIVVQAQVSSQPLRQITPVLVHPTSPSPFLDPGTHQQPPPTEVPVQVARLDASKIYPVTTQLNSTMSEIFAALDRSPRLWAISCIRPNDSESPNSFDKRRVKAQIRSLLLPDIVARKTGNGADFVIGCDQLEFCERFVPTMQGQEEERIAQCARSNGWREGHDYVIGGGAGVGKVWMTYDAWKTVEDVVRIREKELKSRSGGGDDEDDGSFLAADEGTDYTHPEGGSLGVHQQDAYYNESADNLLPPGHRAYANAGGVGGYAEDSQWAGEGNWDKKGGSLPGSPGAPPYSPASKEAMGGMVVKDAPNAVEEVPTTRSRRVWLWIVWGTTFWIPSFVLRYLGRMKRPDVQMAWREKVTIFWLIFVLNAVVIFYIVVFGRLLCPNYDKAWNINELGEHTGYNDFFVSVRGYVYDVSNFVHGDHSDVTGLVSNSPDVLDLLAGQDLSYYFPPPLTLACPSLVTQSTLVLTAKNFTPEAPQAIHNSGTPQESSALSQSNWYTSNFLPTMKQFQKGNLVFEWNDIQSEALNTDTAKIWAVYDNTLYDLTDYVYTQDLTTANSQTYDFLDSNIVNLFQQRSGQDITSVMQSVLNQMSASDRTAQLDCLNNYFMVGLTDFRQTARCQVQQWMLIAASAVLMASMALKCESVWFVVSRNGLLILVRFQSWQPFSWARSEHPSCKINSCFVRYPAIPKARILCAGLLTRLRR